MPTFGRVRCNGMPRLVIIGGVDCMILLRRRPSACEHVFVKCNGISVDRDSMY